MLEMRSKSEPARRNGADARQPPEPASSGSAHDDLALEVLGQFRLIFKSARKHFDSIQARAGVSGAQLWVLSAIARAPGMRVNELARTMAIHQSTASNLIERLERLSLLTRERDKGDQRVVRLHLTPAARKIVAKAPGPPEGILPDALKRLPAEELADLRTSLVKLTGILQVRDARGNKTPLSEI